jgi:DedD protein
MRIPFLKPKPATQLEPPAPGAETGAVQAARTMARRRLAGALVLLVVGVLAFPVLFETQPRPIAVDTPILMPPREAAPAVRTAPSPMPVTTLPADAGTEAPAPVASAPAGVAPPAMPAERSTTEVPSPAAPPNVAVAPAPAAAPASAPTSAPAMPPAKATPPPDDGARARALLDNQPAAADAKASTARFVVQAGAYGEAGALRDARQKVEKLGFKTYTQVIENDAGKRTRVRVGPFATRQEAEAVAAKVKAAGLQANILAL